MNLPAGLATRQAKGAALRQVAGRQILPPFRVFPGQKQPYRHHGQPDRRGECSSTLTRTDYIAAYQAVQAAFLPRPHGTVPLTVTLPIVTRFIDKYDTDL